MKSDFKRFRRLRRMATVVGFGGFFPDFALGCWLGNSTLALAICLPVAFVVMFTWLAVSWSAYDCLICPKRGHRVVKPGRNTFDKEQCACYRAIWNGQPVICVHCGAKVETA